MTTIYELEEMDFVNWDAAAPDTGFPLPTTEEEASNALDVAPVSSQQDMDLVFHDLDGDEWANWALEHFASTQASKQETMVPANTDAETCDPAVTTWYWEAPESPCNHCAQGAYSCKLIREGKYKGYCTSCVALRCECSFGPTVNNLSAEVGATFPANPWPIMGDRPETSILLEDELAAIIHSEPRDSGLVSLAEDNAEVPAPPPNPQNMPKIGARFSRESVKILKNWVSTHSRHPYPTEEEKETLQRMTGLSKTQITNWLANARRRGKIHITRATSPHIGRGYAQAIDIPQRPGTPSMFESMNPLQRWANSPPENEPASVTAIARAVSASYSQASSNSGRNSPYVSGLSDDGSGRSLCNQSSASSFGTSHSSGGSWASSFSHNSRGSSVPSFVRTRGRRRRRRALSKPADEPLNQPLKTFQCTFCTETFRTKHDWQRHEKSLHLSLERWVCCPDGPRSVNPESGAPSCVFCGLANPDDAHIESHNYTGCIERTQEERTFYRKDHLRQHLKLVHNVKFLAWSMDKWHANTPQIRSRCGFCGIIMDSWCIRIDHLAEHFKTGKSMADWKGDWGFEAPVLEMVENSMPPCERPSGFPTLAKSLPVSDLIHDERQTPLPYMASRNPAWTPSNAYELLKIELQYWIGRRLSDTGRAPTDVEIQHEACCIVFCSDIHNRSTANPGSSWLRDLIMSSEEIISSAIYRPIRSQTESGLAQLRINGKSNIFEECQLERELQEFVKAKQLLGLTAMDQELQVEACRIIGRFEESSGNPSDRVANWLLRLIYDSTKWLQGFRQRAHLPRSEDLVDVNQRSKDPTTIDSTIHNYSRLERELGEYLQTQRSLGSEPTDATLQRQARIIIYDIDDEWNQTAADDDEWLSHFRQRHPPLGQGSAPGSASATAPTASGWPTTQTAASPQIGGGPSMQDPSAMNTVSGDTVSVPSPEHLGGVFRKGTIRLDHLAFNEANYYGLLARGLSRFVAATTSANNPNRHVPTDEELRHQSRWIVYDNDDPLNSTSADNPEWLDRFKRDVGLLPKDSGPGLGRNHTPPPITEGTDFSGVLFPPPPPPPPHSGKNHKNNKNGQSTASAAKFTTAPSPTSPTALGSILNSRQLEKGLAEYVKRELRHTGGVFPSDDSLRERARNILSMQSTPCDDPVRLGRFKAALQESVAAAASFMQSPSIGPGSVGTSREVFSPMTTTPQPSLHNSNISGITVGLESLGPTAPAPATAGPDPSIDFGLDAIDSQPPLTTSMNLDLDLDLDVDPGNIGDISSF